MGPAPILQGVVTNLPQIGDNPPHVAFAAPEIARLNGYLPSLAIRWASRETFRRAALRWPMPFCAARMMAGSASAMAATAAARSPAEIASSTLRTALRKRVRRDRLTMVRRALWRAAFLADDVLAMTDRTRPVGTNVVVSERKRDA